MRILYNEKGEWDLDHIYDEDGIPLSCYEQQTRVERRIAEENSDLSIELIAEAQEQALQAIEEGAAF